MIEILPVSILYPSEMQNPTVLHVIRRESVYLLETMNGYVVTFTPSTMLRIH